jgi:hypothetical protein
VLGMAPRVSSSIIGTDTCQEDNRWIMGDCIVKLGPMKSVTEMLDAAARDAARAAADLLPLAYTELRTLTAVRLASEKPE